MASIVECIEIWGWVDHNCKCEEPQATLNCFSAHCRSSINRFGWMNKTECMWINHGWMDTKMDLYSILNTIGQPKHFDIIRSLNLYLRNGTECKSQAWYEHVGDPFVLAVEQQWEESPEVHCVSELDYIWLLCYIWQWHVTVDKDNLKGCNQCPTSEGNPSIVLTLEQLECKPLI